MNDANSPHYSSNNSTIGRYGQHQAQLDQQRKQQNFKDQRFNQGTQHQSLPQFSSHIQSPSVNQISQRLPQNWGLINQKTNATEAPHTTPNIKNLFTNHPTLTEMSLRNQQPVNRNIQFYGESALNRDHQTERLREQQQLLDFMVYQDYQDQNSSRINEKVAQPVWASYNFKNGVYIRPNSPTNRNTNKKNTSAVQSANRTSRNITQLNPANNPNHRLNNTAASNMVSEEKKIDPTPTPLEEYKHNVRYQNIRRIQAQQYCLPTEEEQPERERNVPPPTVNLYSPQPEVNSPDVNLLNGPAISTYNSAPILSPNLTELWNISHILTAATTNTVGSTALGSQLLNITPSDIRSRLIFQRNDDAQALSFQRPPPPSPLKTEDQSEQLDQTQTQIRFLNDTYLQQQLQNNSNEILSQSVQHQNEQLNGNGLDNLSVASSIYREALENQQKSSSQTVRAFDQQVDENQKEIFRIIQSQMLTQDNNSLKMRIQQMEQEMNQLRQQNLELQRVILSHSRGCPQFNQQLSLLQQQMQFVQQQSRSSQPYASSLNQEMSQLSLHNERANDEEEKLN